MIGNKLEPFKFWCQKVLPNVYDDSLSYYEYLCKLNEYLNEVIGQINTLTDNMEDYEANLTATWLETKEYIDNYFNNLDVQEEINNKLNQMAESGALSTLLAPIVGTQIGGVVAEQIGGTVANQIGNTVASQIGPVVASQIDEPTANAVNAWLNKNVNPVGSAVVVDNTLTITGAAADAKVTGDKITDLEETTELCFVNNEAVTDGQVIFTKNDVIVGETIKYDLYVNSPYKSFYIETLDANNTRINVYGIASSSTAEQRATGSFTITSNVAKCVAHHNSTVVYTATVKGIYPLRTKIMENISDLNDEITNRINADNAVKSEILDNVLINGTSYENNDEIFTINDVWIGEEFTYTLTATSPYRQAYMKLLDSKGNELAKYGITVSTSSETTVTGTFTITSNFAKCVASISNVDTTFTLQLISNYSIYDEIKNINNDIEKPTLYHILITGQSLAVGAEGTPSITTYCPLKYEGKAYMFNGQCRLPNIYNSESQHISWPDRTDDSYMSSLTGLHEKDSSELQYNDQGQLVNCGWGETIGSITGYWFADKTNNKVLVSNHAYGGKSYQNLKKGTIPYENTLRAVHRAKALCEQYKWDYKVIGICVIHGEADTTYDVTTEQYMGYLEEWQNDYDGDIKAITGQNETIKFYLSQTDYAACEGKDAYVANADFLESIINPTKFKLVAPEYIWPIVYLSSHMNAKGYRILGEYFGQTIWRDFNGLPSRTIYPYKCETNLNVITLTFNALNSANLQFDNSLITGVTNHGFDVTDSGGAVITDIQITNRPYQVIITCDKVLQSDATVSYAYKAKPEYTGHLPGYQTGCRGNLRDTDWFASIVPVDGVSYVDWCSIFSVPINWNPLNL